MPDLRKLMVRDGIIYLILMGILTAGIIVATTRILDSIDSQMATLRKELANTGLTVNEHLIWNNQIHQAEVDTNLFMSEFELLTIDPDRNFEKIIPVISRIQQHAQLFEDMAPPVSQERLKYLKEYIWILEGLGLDLLDSKGPNERQQLYDDTIEFANAIESNVESMEIETRSQMTVLQQQVVETIEESAAKQRELVQSIQQLNLIFIASLIVGILIVSGLFLFRFRSFSNRLLMLDQYAIDIANEKYGLPPFSSKDLTGRLSTRMGMMSRTIRKGLIELKSSSQEISALAYYDALTGLENRRLFNDNLNKVILLSHRYKDRYALLCLDLDRFKEINDTYGHNVGDNVLKEVASRLQIILREEDNVARLGGDEFAVLFRNDNDDVSDLAQRILDSMNQPMLFGELELKVSSSIGIAVLGTDADNASDLLRYADMALYKAKAEGRNKYHYFSEQLGAIAQRRVETTQKLSVAIENGELELFYQPKLNMADKRTNGAEALIRWPQPEGGFIYPDEFIPLAEESGLIMAMGYWIINQACYDARVLNDITGPLTVAINLSTKQFSDPELLDRIIASCARHKVPHDLIELEVTESLLLDDIDSSVAILNSMREAGFGIALDDFGTGYSSLFYLKNLPVSCVKIDRSFVEGIPGDSKDSAIVSSTIRLAHELGLSIVAEGIETDQQSDFLQASGCDTAQGYLFGKPQPLFAFLDNLDLNSPKL